MRRLDLVVGPNGAGKSTFVLERLHPLLPLSTFVNADVIAAERWPGRTTEHSYDAARVAANIRATLIEHGESFIAETVFSHPSKLDLIDTAHRSGYIVVLHVILVPEPLTVARVAERVADGGHPVPEEKIRGRYRRLWPLVAEAMRRADHTTVYDNTAADVTRVVARFVDGDPVGGPDRPAWTPEPVLQLDV